MRQVTAEDIYSWMFGCTLSEAAEFIALKFNNILKEASQPERTPLPTVEESCATCRFWYSDDELCRRYPPVFNAQYCEELGCLTKNGWQPITTNDDWCGEWKQSKKDGA